MNLDPTLLSIIVCPDCHGKLEPVAEELVCTGVRPDLPGA